MNRVIGPVIFSAKAPGTATRTMPPPFPNYPLTPNR